jgi:hypothetical protein
VPISRDDAINTVITNVIDPHPLGDILYGYAFLSPVPSGTEIGQLSFDSLDSLGTAADSSWFFWLDLAPLANFGHPTKMILVNAQTGAIDLDVDALSWPVIDGVEHYETPGRFLSPDIFLSSGIAEPKRTRREEIAPDDSRPPAERTPGVWGVIVSPYSATEAYRAHDVNRMKTAFMNAGVDSPVVVAGQSLANTRAALQALPNDCSKLYVYWTGHGSADKLWFPAAPGDSAKALSATDFACDVTGNDADEYCVILETCGSGTLLDDLADKGANGFHMTAADSGFGWFSPEGSLFTFFLSECLEGGFTGLEALNWAEIQLDAWWDSVATADPTTWGSTNADSTNHDPTGGYVAKLTSSGGTNSKGATFTIASDCSTVCVDIRPTPPVPANPCGNFTLFCDPGTGAWQKRATYNWTVNQNTYFRTNAGALPVRYRIAMHANHLGANALITWESGTQTPETPVVVNNFNSFSIGWVDGSSGEFDPVLGQGSNGAHFVPWTDGIFLDQVPATTGPQWFTDLTYDVPIDVDFSRPELYAFGDPFQGFELDTSLLFFFDHVVDPFTGVPGGTAFFEATVFQPSLGTLGPFPGLEPRPDLPGAGHGHGRRAGTERGSVGRDRDAFRRWRGNVGAAACDPHGGSPAPCGGPEPVSDGNPNRLRAHARGARAALGVRRRGPGGQRPPRGDLAGGSTFDRLGRARRTRKARGGGCLLLSSGIGGSSRVEPNGETPLAPLGLRTTTVFDPPEWSGRSAP